MRGATPERTARKRALAAEDMKVLSNQLTSSTTLTIEKALARIAEAMIILLEENNEK